MNKATPLTIAIFDIGSNAVRLTIYRAQIDAPPLILGKAVELCQLGRAHAGGNTLYPEGRTHTIETLQRYGQMIRAPQYRCTHYVAVATEAIRRADDGTEFVEMIREKFGLNVRILTNEEEGMYGGHGVLASLPTAQGLVADLGGGSLQVTKIAHGQVFETTSLPLGTLRLLGAGPRYQEMIADLIGESLPLSLQSADALYIIGGAWRSFAKIYLARAGKDPRNVQGTLLEPDKIQAVANWILEGGDQTILSLQTDYHLERARAESLPQAAFLLTYLIDLIHPSGVIVSSAGLRDGILQAVLSGALKSDPVPTTHTITQ